MDEADDCPEDSAKDPANDRFDEIKERVLSVAGGSAISLRGMIGLGFGHLGEGNKESSRGAEWLGG